jgi:hypothetical protein
MLLHRLGQRQVFLLDPVRSVDQVNGKIVVRVRATDAQFGSVRRDHACRKGG